MTAKKRLVDVRQELDAQHQQTKEFTNKRTVYVKKKTALQIEKRFRQYPKQKLSEIVERLLTSCLESSNPATSDHQNNLQRKSQSDDNDDETVATPEN